MYVRDLQIIKFVKTLAYVTKDIAVELGYFNMMFL